MKIIEGSILDVMKRVREDESIIRRYFHFQSRFWRALQEHIVRGNSPEVIEFPVDYYGQPMLLMKYRGQYPISYKNFHHYGTQFDKDSKPYELDYYSLDLSVDFIKEDDRDSEYPNVCTKDFSLKVPKQLEEDFNDVDFREWTMRTGEEIYQRRMTKNLKELDKLIKAYPVQAKEIVCTLAT